MQPWEWAIVFRGRESLEDLSWAQQFIEKKQIPPEQAGNKFMGFIPYRRKNLQGVSVHAGAAFYDHKPVTLKLYTEYGGVCGAVSKGAAGFLRAKGVPAWAIGQPGHLRLYLETPRRTLENRQQHQRMELVNGKKPDTLERPRPAHPGLQCPSFITVWRKNPS